jgi:DNA ligase D-like protein (predicted 3'-phosphoesterase)
MADAKGIPDRSEYGDLGKLSPGQLLSYVVQQHDANRAGRHYDVRFGNKDTGLFSWAARKGIPSPGEKHLAVLQPVHDFEYGKFEGTIPSGYGAGTVKKFDEGKALITKVMPNQINFTLAHKKYPQRFTLVKPEGGIGQKENNWLLINSTPTQRIGYAKVPYKVIPQEDIESILKNLPSDANVQAKIDGSASLTHILKDKIEVLSLRHSKVNDRPIIHTERALKTIPTVEMPKQYHNSLLRGELYGQQNDKVIEPQRLSGLLNSSVAKSITDQNNQGIQLKNLVFDIARQGNKNVDYNKVPYADRLNTVKNILQSIKGPDADLVQSKFHLPEEAKTPIDALNLWDDIKNKKHPLSEEGIIIHPSLGRPTKTKLTDEHNVWIRAIAPGKAKWQDRGAGAFLYSHTPTGRIVSEVGTGFSDKLRQDMYNDPASFIGRSARVRATRKLPNDVLFQPSFISLND